MLSHQRKRMIVELKETVVPYLREQKFNGSFPHFRRFQSDRIDLLTFQFNKWGGSFVVELAVASPEGYVMDWGDHISPKKITAHHVNKRQRLGSPNLHNDGIWFNYELAENRSDYSIVAHNVIRSLKKAESIWSLLPLN